MALTYTITGLQTQLSLVGTAIDGADFPTAKAELAKAHLILVGLPLESQADGRVVKMRSDLEKVSALLETASSASTAADRRRLWRTGTSHG